MVARNPFMAGPQAPFLMDQNDLYRAVQHYLHGVKDNELKVLILPEDEENPLRRTLPAPVPLGVWAWNEDASAPKYVTPDDLYDSSLVAADIQDIRDSKADIEALALKADASEVDAALALKADAAYVYGRLEELRQGQQAGMLGFATKADMDGDLAHPDGTLALVTNDSTPANNGTYRKQGASGAGSWLQSED